jgi:glycosyltransferase involved in cell wall biosynthesis
MQPLVSVIVPAFDAAATIDETLDSVLRQTYGNFDVLVVDDGSEDDTAAKVERFASRDSRISLVRQHQCGIAAARNLAIERSSGEFVAPLDADDLWHPRKLELQVRCLEAAPASVALCYCWWRNIDSRGRVLYPGPRWREEGRVFDRLLAVNFVGCASIPLIRREPLVRAEGYSADLRRANGEGCEDWDLYLRLAEDYELRVVPEILVSYRSQEQSISSDLQTMQRSHELLLARVCDRHPDVAEATLAQSRSNLSLHLAGVQFKQSDFLGTSRWVLRAFRLHPATTVRFLAKSAPTILGGFLRNTCGGVTATS